MNPAAQWKAEKAGDYVLGELESIEARNSAYGRFFLATVVVDEGAQNGKALTKGTPLSVAFVGAALRQRAASMGFKVGATCERAVLGVTYVGEQPSDKGNPTKVFNTVLRGTITGGVPLSDVADLDAAPMAFANGEEEPF